MRRGLTLVELLVVLAILVVVGAIGWGSMRGHLPRYRLVSASRQLKSDLVQMRNLAISSNRETRLRLLASGGDCDDPEAWGGSWMLEIGDRSNSSTTWDALPEDSLVDGSDDDQSAGLVDLGADGNRKARWICLDDWGTLAGPGTGNADAIVFSPRGRVSNPGTDFVQGSGWISLDLVNQAAAREGVTDRVSVKIDRVGMVRLESSLADAAPQAAIGTGTASTAPSSSAP